MRLYLDEIMDDESQYGNKTNEIKTFVVDAYYYGYSIKEIVKKLQDKYYLFDDEEQTQYETEIVNDIIKEEFKL